MGEQTAPKEDQPSTSPPTEKASAATSDGADAKDQPVKLTTAAQLRANLVLLERAVLSKDTRLIVGRLLRQTAAVRQQLKPPMLKSLISESLPETCSTRVLMLEQLNQVLIALHECIPSLQHNA